MRGFVTGVIIGVTVGYMFSDVIDEAREAVVDGMRKAREAEVDNESVKYSQVDDNISRASTRFPANGSGLPVDRIVEINNSTPENPVWVAQEEMDVMNQTYLRVAIGAGRLKIVGYHPEPLE